MHDDILCVIMGMASENEQNKDTRKKTTGPCKRVIEATKLNAETDPRDQRAAIRHNIHPDTSKQTTTTLCRNESGEKRKKGETGGDMI